MLQKNANGAFLSLIQPPEIDLEVESLVRYHSDT